MAAVPQGCYRGPGHDRWVVISAGCDQEWSALATVMGQTELVADARCAPSIDRVANHDALDALIVGWTA